MPFPGGGGLGLRPAPRSELSQATVLGWVRAERAARILGHLAPGRGWFGSSGMVPSGLRLLQACVTRLCLHALAAGGRVLSKQRRTDSTGLSWDSHRPPWGLRSRDPEAWGMGGRVEGADPAAPVGSCSGLLGLFFLDRACLDPQHGLSPPTRGPSCFFSHRAPPSGERCSLHHPLQSLPCRPPRSPDPKPGPSLSVLRGAFVVLSVSERRHSIAETEHRRFHGVTRL